MKIKLDENLGSRGAELLREAGHDVRTVFDQGLAGAEDPAIAEVCRVEARCLVTLDLGFGEFWVEVIPVGRIVRPVRFGSEDGAVWVEADAAIDTGSTHCQIPESVAAQLHARLYRRTRVRLVDGRIGERDIVYVLLDIDPTLPPLLTTAVVSGEGSPFLIGAVPLEQMGLGLDPTGDRLVPDIAALLSFTEWRTF